MDNMKPVGVLDSGVGGISILKALIKFLPHENFVYIGDSANAPYGEKSREEIAKLTFDSVNRLLDEGCKAVVVACNTATAAAINDLRETYPNIPMIGLEPAVKPAVLSHPGGRVVVMATPFTLKEKKYKKLVKRYVDMAEIIPLPAPKLVTFAEAREYDSENVRAYLSELFEPLKDRPIDAVVLGCTHFPFLMNAISEIAGKDAALYDSATGVGNEVRRQLQRHGLINDSEGTGTVKIINSGGEFFEKLSERLLYGK